MFGENLKKYRKRAGLTQSQLGDCLGIDYSHVGKWERNVNRPRLEMVEKIANVLGVSISNLYSHAGDTNVEYWGDFPAEMKPLSCPSLYREDEVADAWMGLYCVFQGLPINSRRAILSLLSKNEI